MTEPLFRADAYLKEAAGTVEAHTELGGVVLDRSLFYPNGGGQPGDGGYLAFGGERMTVATTVKGEADQIVLLPDEGESLPPVGASVIQVLDWDHRYRLMRVHTALHLLSAVIPLPVSGGQISAEKGRLDFDMPEAMEDKTAVERALNELIARDLEVSSSWITDDELAAKPEMVKTMSVKPPVCSGRVRLIRIGTNDVLVDLQPCGGTHVQKTSEIGPIALGKVQKKGARNRRVNIHLT